MKLPDRSTLSKARFSAIDRKKEEAGRARLGYSLALEEAGEITREGDSEDDAQKGV